jgi:hypothetical protein
MSVRLFAIACALLAAGEASAVYRTPPSSGPPRWTRVNWPAPPIRWTCVEAGLREVELGGRACLQTMNGPRIGVCERVDNMTNWRVGDEPCR